MRRRIGIFRAGEEALALIPLLTANPGIEIARVFDDDAEGLTRRFGSLEPGVAALLEQVLSDDLEAFVGDESLDAVIDASPEGSFASDHPDMARRGVQVLTPLTARLLWAYGATASDRKTELLQALHEVVESYNLTIDTDELFTRMLEIALSVTGAEGGSVMLLDPERQELTVRVAAGVEPELWPKIRVKLGEGIAGRVAAEGRPLRLRGKADRQRFQIVRERLDVESALCVPLVHEGRSLGVLNLHHGSRADAFNEADLDFAEELARLDAQIIARAQEHLSLRRQAARYTAVRRVHSLMAQSGALADRLAQVARYVSEAAGGGITTVYLHDPDDDALRVAASSLASNPFGSEIRVAVGEGIDGSVAQSGDPVFLRRSDGSLGYAALPLLAGDSLIGVLSLQCGFGEGQLQDDVLLEVAADVATEVAQAEREARTAARATKISAINEAGIRMVSTDDASEILRLATSSAAIALESDHAVLRLQDPETRRFVIRSYFGSADGVLQEQLFRMDRHVSVDTLKRRAPLLVREADRDPMLRAFETDVRSLMAAPLRRDGRVVGTLALYEKVAADRFYPGRFAKDDLELFAKYASYVERALESAQLQSAARDQQSFDEETSLPNRRYFAVRVQEELARAGTRENALCIAVARIENLAEIDGGDDADKPARVIRCVVQSLQQRSRSFDVVGRIADDAFAVLMPEPGAEPSARVTALARAVAEDVTTDDALNDPVRVSLAFGYATVPEDGLDPDSLLARAAVARIHMV
jgi:diguanylate cyclase (GGDEF)-like protein